MHTTPTWWDLEQKKSFKNNLSFKNKKRQGQWGWNILDLSEGSWREFTISAGKARCQDHKLKGAVTNSLQWLDDFNQIFNHLLWLIFLNSNEKTKAFPWVKQTSKSKTVFFLLFGNIKNRKPFELRYAIHLTSETHFYNVKQALYSTPLNVYALYCMRICACNHASYAQA